MLTIEFAHIAFGFASLVFGTWVVFNRKGTRTHRRIGVAYFVSMLGLNLTAFGIYKLFGGFGIFHWAALASLASTIPAVLVVRFQHRLKGWLPMHYYFMGWSYIGLLGATSNEFYVNVPFANALAQQYVWLPNVQLLVLFTVGGLFLYSRESATLSRLQQGRV